MPNSTLELLRTYGELLPSAEKLLDLASNQQQGEILDTLHILLAALTSPDQETPGCEALVNTIDAKARARWITRLQFEVQDGIDSPALADGTTQRLRRYAEQCGQEARRRKLSITDAFILWIIISKDALTKQMMQEKYQINVELVLSRLENNFRQSAPFPLVFPPPSLPSLDEAALAKAMQLTRVLHYDASSPGDKDMHDVPMNFFLNALGRSATSLEGEIIILAGHHGSPVEALPQILARRIASQDQFKGVRAPLNGYATVRRLNLEAVLRLVDEPREPPPYKVVEKAKQYALDEKAILLLDHIHLIKGQGMVERSIKAALADRGDGLIFGLYVYSGAPPPQHDLLLGMSNTHVMRNEQQLRCEQR